MDFGSGSLALQQIPKGAEIPQNPDAEAALLAAMMLSPDVVEEAFELVREDQFYRPANRKVFSAMYDLYEQGAPIDQVSVADRLKIRNELEHIGGKPYILELANNSFALINWKNHAEIIKRAAILRELIGASTKITALAFEGSDDVDDIIVASEKLLLDVTNRRIETQFRPLAELLTETYSSIEEHSNNRSQLQGVTSGFADVDRALTGFKPGALIILAARPGIGKTSFALNMAINAAKKGTSIAFFSLEMAAAELTQRVLCSEANVNSMKVQTGHLDEEDWLPLVNATNSLSQIDFWVDDTPGTNITEIRAKARRQLRNKKNGMVIVDYLQLMNPQGKAALENRNVAVAEMSRGLKILAKDLGMPVIALSQLSREVERRKDKRPVLADLRESGSIEQDADVVMFIDRSTSEEEESRPDRPDKNVANLIIAKNRSGPTGDIPLVFLPDHTKFVSFSHEL